jgi:hypothetical protein
MMKERKDCSIRGKAQNQVSYVSVHAKETMISLQNRKGPQMYIIGCSIKEDVKQ